MATVLARVEAFIRSSTTEQIRARLDELMAEPPLTQPRENMEEEMLLAKHRGRMFLLRKGEVTEPVSGKNIKIGRPIFKEIIKSGLFKYDPQLNMFVVAK